VLWRCCDFGPRWRS